MFPGFFVNSNISRVRIVLLSSTWHLSKWNLVKYARPTSSKEKEQHEIKMAGQDKRHKSERTNANPALYPTGFTCLSKGPPVKAHTGYGTFSHSALSQGLKQLSKGPLCHSNSEEYRNPGNSYSINIYWGTSFQGLEWERDKERSKILGAGILWSNKCPGTSFLAWYR